MKEGKGTTLLTNSLVPSNHERVDHCTNNHIEEYSRIGGKIKFSTMIRNSVNTVELFTPLPPNFL